MHGQLGVDAHRIVLDVKAGGPPISGRITNGPRATQFTGWIGLLSALEEAIAGHGGTDSKRAQGLRDS
jgi:hypothetical protein